MSTSEAPRSTAESRALSGVPQGNLVGEGWSYDGGGEPLGVENPATGEILRELPDASAADGLRALDAAAAAQRGWGTTPPAERRDLLRRAYDAVVADGERLALLITLEMGKPLVEARAEVRYGSEYLRWYSEEATRINGRYADAPGGWGRILTRRDPIGPCLLITPWNFPLAMATRKLAPAFAAGCTAILKPAPQTPLTGLLLAQIFLDAGLPPGVLSVLCTSDAAGVTAPLIRDGRIRKLSFTGSTAVGRKLLAQAADNVVRSSMELGGNAALLVFDDADLETAVSQAVVAKIRNGGQSCIAANRILVQAGIAEEFTKAFAERLRAIRMGPGTEDVELGPMIDAAAVRRLSEVVEDARAHGGSLVVGGGRSSRPGHFFEPTVIEGMSGEARILNEEIFGPVAPVTTFADEDEAIRAAGATEHGLASYVFTTDLDRALRVAESLDTGMVGLNRGVVSDAAAPFGGVKQSGIGREGGSEGLEEYLSMKYIALTAPSASPVMDLRPARAREQTPPQP